MPNQPRKGGWKEEGGVRKVVSTAPGASQAVRGGPDSPWCTQRRRRRMRSGRMSSHGGPAPTHVFPGAPWGSEASFRSCGNAAGFPHNLFGQKLGEVKMKPRAHHGRTGRRLGEQPPHQSHRAPGALHEPLQAAFCCHTGTESSQHAHGKACPQNPATSTEKQTERSVKKAAERVGGYVGR